MVVLRKCFLCLNNMCMLHTLCLSKNEIGILNYFNFLTIKPVLYILNINYKDNDSVFIKGILDKLNKLNFFSRSMVVFICASFELTLRKKVEFFKKQIYKESRLYNIIFAIYKLLGLYTCFTFNEEEIRAWNVINNTVIIRLANKIHTDFSKKFVRAKVMSCKDLLYFTGKWSATKYDKIRLEGKKYSIQDGDVINFVISK